MKSLSLISSLIVLSLSFSAQSQTHRQETARAESAESKAALKEKKKALACMLTRPFVFGASISAGYSGFSDGIAGMMTGGSYHGTNSDPTTLLAKSVVKNAEVTNIAEIINTLPGNATGFIQIKRAMKDPDLREKIKKTTLLSSIDGFYWPMVFGWCDDAEKGARYLIDLAAKLGKPIVLGTVPKEDPNKVDPSFRAFWSPPQPACSRRLNKYLKDNCHLEKGCYLVDMERYVAQLNSTGIMYHGKRVYYNDIRADGVHLSKLGLQWAQEELVGILSQAAPLCQRSN